MNIMRFNKHLIEWIYPAAIIALAIFYFTPGGTGLFYTRNSIKQVQDYLSYAREEKHVASCHMDFVSPKGGYAFVKGFGFSCQIPPQLGLPLLADKAGLVLPLLKDTPSTHFTLNLAPGARWPVGKTISVYLNDHLIARGPASTSGFKIDCQFKLHDPHEYFSALIISNDQASPPNALASPSGAITRDTWAYLKSFQMSP